MAADDLHKKKKKTLKERKKYDSETGFSPIEGNFNETNEKVKKKSNKKKNKYSEDSSERANAINFAIVKDETHDVNDGSNKSKRMKDKKRKNTRTMSRAEEISHSHSTEDENEEGFESEPKAKKLRKSRKKKRENIDTENDDVSGTQDGTLAEKKGEDVEDDCYEMSSGDEDYSKGMTKWISQYHRSRPGLKVLQERIDDFIMNHEAQEAKARAEREAQVAEGGWTVVVHHKGRKKTTDTETGVAVGSVAQAAVLDKMSKKKKKEVGLNFYRFQKKEAQMNEIMMLQSKFEQDKKRIQQLRAARKFRPY
ncbi:uncharacterized protein LOC127240084 isoform X2 [Andrographis paniculata]|uniref:uncharacterized protein LOC127240084 isoform X2 n=1 Tax=Andrographis paniculata TaxID=175694 RepID=UPI0021E9674D|nr:uncharacterized protein LOC127240084 isoform X2 [Andrographis paniculata]